MLVTSRWKGRLVEGGRSPQAVAESRQGLIISFKTISGMAVEGVVEEIGRPRMRRDVAREAWSILFTWLVSWSILSSRFTISSRSAAFSLTRT